MAGKKNTKPKEPTTNQKLEMLLANDKCLDKHLTSVQQELSNVKFKLNQQEHKQKQNCPHKNIKIGFVVSKNGYAMDWSQSKCIECGAGIKVFPADDTKLTKLAKKVYKHIQKTRM